MTQRATKSLKERNRVPLFGIVLINVTIFYMLASSADLSLTGLKEALLDVKNVLAIGGVGALATVTVFNGIVPTPLKERFVFWRWHDYLPSNRAFTVYGPRDPRVDMAALERRFGILPTKPADQSRAWYKLFKQCDTQPEILQAHQSYLFARDYTAISGVFLVCAGSLSFVVLPNARTTLAYLGFLMVQCLVTCLSARHHGTRMVANTLALQNRS
jgi:hypothetical protein